MIDDIEQSRQDEQIDRSDIEADLVRTFRRVADQIDANWENDTVDPDLQVKWVRTLG